MLILIDVCFIKEPRVDQDIELLICLPESFVLAFLKIKELILHIDAFFVLNDDYLIISIVALILEATQLLYIYLFITESLIMHLQPMKLHLLSVLKGDKLFLKAILIIAQVMRHPEVYLQTVVVLIVAVLLLLSADIAKIMVHVHMSFELVLIEVVLVAETAIRMHKGYIAEFVDVSLLKMLVQCFESVQFLLLQHTGFLFHADFADIAIVVVFQVLFEEGNRGKFLVHLAWFAIDFDKALKLS